MDRQEFDSKRKGLTPTQKVDFEYFLKSKNDDEIADLRDVDRSSVNRNITNIATVFGIKRNKIKSSNGKDNPEKKVHRQKLLKLCLTYIPDEVTQPHIYDEFYDDLVAKIQRPSLTSDRPHTPTNPQNIPTPDHTQELTPLEFIGRDRDLNNLSNLSRQAKIVLIKGGEGVGKSRLARQFLDTHFLKMIEIDIVLSSGEINLPTNALKQILIDDLNIQPRENFSDNLKILKKRLLDKENPIGILIDSLEPTLNESFQFHKNFRGYDDLLEVLYDHRVSSFTLITSRTSLISQRVVLLPYLLEGLDINSWKQYFSDSENAETSESLIQIHGSCDGNARIMNILHRDITNPKSFNGNIKSYWERY